MESEPIDCRDINPEWVKKMNSNIPSEIIYADDCDFITELLKKKNRIHEVSKRTLKEDNLLVNEETTENTIVKRGTKEKERG